MCYYILYGGLGVMNNALEISKYIINHEQIEQRYIDNLRLQKILYFIQAVILCNTDHTCFNDEMQAWEYGPVVPTVYHEFKSYGSMNINKKYNVSLSFPDKEDENLIINMLDYLKSYSTSQLITITHNQDPWRNAYRNGINSEITPESIKIYFKKNSSC